GQHDVDLLVVRQIVQRGDDGPAIHLSLIDLLGSVVKPGGIAKADRIRRRKEAESWMRPDHPALVEEGETARHFEDALNNEHHVGTARVIFIETQRDIVLQRPRQDAILELGHLQAILDDNRVLADEIDAGYVTVEAYPHAWPVQPRRDLLDMRRLAGAVIAGGHHPAILGKAC